MLPKRLNQEEISERTKVRRIQKVERVIAQTASLGSAPFPQPPDPISSDSDFELESSADDENVRPPTPTNGQIFDENNENTTDDARSISSSISGDDFNAEDDELNCDSSQSSQTSNRSSEATEEAIEGIFGPAEGVLDNNNRNNHPEVIIAELDERVCACSNTTQGEALLMVLTLGLRHNMSYAAMVDNLELLNNVLQREVIPANIYHLLKQVEPENTQDLYHIVCPACGIYLKALSKEILKSSVSCECGFLIEDAKNTSSFFMTLGMKNQLKNLLEQEGIADALKYRFNRKKLNNEALEDVYDGDLYKQLSSAGKPLSDEKNVSYSFNTDGAAYGDTSHQQIWPIYIMINELPPKLRVKNMLLVGIWVGRSEPDMNVVMQPFVDEANELSENGFSWKHPLNGETQSVAIPLCCVVDSQARWRLLNHKSPAGYYGCTFCEIVGVHVSKCGIRFGMQEDVPELRTHEGMKRHMVEAHGRQHLPEKSRSVKGCKGVCPLMNLKYFDLALGFVPDFLHMAKGVVEQNINCILSRLSAEEINTISENISKIVTPSAVTRSVCHLSDPSVVRPY